MTMTISYIMLALSGLFYFCSFLGHVRSFQGGKEGHRAAFALMRIGFLLGTLYFVAQSIREGSFLPVLNLEQALAFFAWSLAFVYLVLFVQIHADSFGLILTPILMLLVAASCFLIQQAGGTVPEAPMPAVMNPYFSVHIVSAFFAYASFTISFAAGILYLIQQRELKQRHAGRIYHKLPALEELERLIYQPMIWGAALLVAAVGIGFLWSKSAFGEYWIFDPKTIATGIIIVLYSAILYLRAIASLRGRQVAILSMIAFAFMVFSFIGTRLIHGSHNYLQ